jgi:hypothetical protein
MRLFVAQKRPTHGGAVAVKRTRITVETETLMIVRRAKVARAWCPKCRQEVEAITLDREGLKNLLTRAEIEDWLSTGKLHRWQTANELSQICVQSLLHCFELENV